MPGIKDRDSPHPPVAMLLLITQGNLGKHLPELLLTADRVRTATGRAPYTFQPTHVAWKGTRRQTVGAAAAIGCSVGNYSWGGPHLTPHRAHTCDVGA